MNSNEWNFNIKTLNLIHKPKQENTSRGIKLIQELTLTKEHKYYQKTEPPNLNMILQGLPKPSRNIGINLTE